MAASDQGRDAFPGGLPGAIAVQEAIRLARLDNSRQAQKDAVGEARALVEFIDEAELPPLKLLDALRRYVLSDQAIETDVHLAIRGVRLISTLHLMALLEVSMIGANPEHSWLHNLMAKEGAEKDWNPMRAFLDRCQQALGLSSTHEFQAVLFAEDNCSIGCLESKKREFRKWRAGERRPTLEEFIRIGKNIDQWNYQYDVDSIDDEDYTMKCLICYYYICLLDFGKMEFFSVAGMFRELAASDLDSLSPLGSADLLLDFARQRIGRAEA